MKLIRVSLLLSLYCPRHITDAKAGGGGGAAAINKMRGKMATDEALKILNLENIKNLDPKILETVRRSELRFRSWLQSVSSLRSLPTIMFRY